MAERASDEKEEVKKRGRNHEESRRVRWTLSQPASLCCYFIFKQKSLNAIFSLFCFLAATSTQFLSVLSTLLDIHRRPQQVYDAHSLTGWPLVWERHRWQWKRAVVWTLAVKHLFKEWVLRTRASFAPGILEQIFFWTTLTAISKKWNSPEVK